MGILFQKVSRRLWAVILVFVLMVGIIGSGSQAASNKVKLAKSKITVKVKQTKKVKIKNVKKKQVRKLTVKSKKSAVATAKKAGKVTIKVTGKEKGSTKVTANLKLKTKVGGKKTYKLKLNVTVKKEDATPTAVPTPIPTEKPVPVVTGASISLEKQEYRCTASGEEIGVVAFLLPDTANEPVEWKIVDDTVAEIVETEPTMDGVATAWVVGIEVGTTYISAKIGAGTTVAKIVVDEGVIAAQLTEVKQTKADELVVSLDVDYRMDNQGLGKDKFDIDVYNDNGINTKTIPVNKIHYELIDIPADSDTGAMVTGTSATLSLDRPFADKDKVVVNLYKGKAFASSKDFTALVGAPAMISLTTSEAQKDVETPIKFALIDTNGIDVTSTVDVDSRVSVDVSGSDAEWDTSLTSRANIKMTKLESTATVTLSYTSETNSTGRPDFQTSGTITCIPPQPVVGDPHYALLFRPVKTWEGSDDKVAMFYKDEEYDDISVGVGDHTEYSFYASSKEDGEAISYDEYSVMTSNDEIAYATVKGEGKFCNITITGFKSGKCYVNIKATKNTVSTYYTIPVKVIELGKLAKFSITPSRKTVTNAFDDLYQMKNSIGVTAEDSEGHDITTADVDNLAVTYEIVSPKKVEPYSFEHSDGGKIVLGSKFTLTQKGIGAKFNSAGAKAGSYTIKATAYYKDVSMTSICTIDVKALPKEVYEFNGNAPKAKYSIEADSKEICLSSAEEGVAQVRLKATIGGLFAGYVYMDEYDTNIYPEGDYSEYNRQAWRTGFVSGSYIGVIGDEVTFSSGTVSGKFEKIGNNIILNRPNAVSKHYQVGGASQILDFRGAVRNGVKWQTDQEGYPNENLPGDWSTASSMICLNDRKTNLDATSFTSGSVILSDTGDRALNFTIYDDANESRMIEFFPDKKNDEFLALPGTYKVMFKWKQPKDNKSSEESKLELKSDSVIINVVDDIVLPVIDIERRSLTELSEESVMEVLRPDCDLNCNISRHASIMGLYDKDIEPVDFSGNSALVKYVKVLDGPNGSDMYIYVPLGAAFTKKE